MSLYCSFPECSNLPERNGICASHNIAARKAERKAGKEKKIYKIPAKSKKKAKEDREYTVLKKGFLSEYPICNVTVLGICNNPAVDIHHSSLSSLNYLNMETWIGCCRNCHTYIETQMSAIARRKAGLLKD